MTDPDRLNGERRPSLHDIARTADVSVSTVSRYLNGQLSLRSETESRVLSAMTQLGYSRSGRVSREGRAGVIGLVVPQIGNTYFGRVADAVVTATEAQGLSVIITSTLNHSRKQLEYVELLASKDVDGMIYLGNYSSNQALNTVIARGLPVVVIDEALVDAPPVDTVLVDDYAGAYQVVTYLTSLGHSKIALVTGSKKLQSVQERMRGYRDALSRAGLSAESQMVLSGDFSHDFGATALSHLLARADPPTAVFAASDTIAMGMMLAAETHGISVPRDLSIVGFDDVPDAMFISPHLTTVRTPLDRMAAVAVGLLVDRIDDPTRAVSHESIGVSLIVRGSTAPPSRTPAQIEELRNAIAQ
jgi:DNA-binding LacI/PurR family transcriptional regulator